MRNSGEDRPNWHPVTGGEHGRAAGRRFPGGSPLVPNSGAPDTADVRSTERKSRRASVLRRPGFRVDPDRWHSSSLDYLERCSAARGFGVAALEKVVRLGPSAYAPGEGSRTRSATSAGEERLSSWDPHAHGRAGAERSQARIGDGNPGLENARTASVSLGACAWPRVPIMPRGCGTRARERRRPIEAGSVATWRPTTGVIRSSSAARRS
jgi:hypothetical protein